MKVGIEELILVDSIYRHTDTGEYYMVKHIGEMKDPITRQWIPAVAYKMLAVSENPGAPLYIREKDDFMRKFMRATLACENHGVVGCAQKGCQI